MREFLTVSWPAFVKLLCMPHPFGSDGMRPRIAEANSRGGFFGYEFSGGFNDSAKWITHHTGIFPVGVVNAPQLVARLQSRSRAHEGSSSKFEEVKVCQAHNDRAQSV